jgi:hypothetical protein
MSTDAVAAETEGKTSGGGLRTRLMAFAALATFLAGIGYVGRQGYLAATDSFVAPAILSPDSDMVIASKVKMAEIYVERGRVVAEIDAIDSDVAASNQAIDRLKTLQATAADGLAWTRGSTNRQVSAASKDLKTLAEQQTVLAQMLEAQKSLTAEAQANYKAGLITKVDLAKEVQSLDQMQLAQLENGRTQMITKAALAEAASAQESLATKSNSPAMPESLMREDQMVRIELEILKLEAECRTKEAGKKVLKDQLAKMDEVEGQLRSRPIFRAVDKNVEVAFVPYTQSDGVVTGATVYDCIWGVFACKPVGRVAEVVPGEMILPDPWGNQARGFFTVLDLDNHEAAKSRILRIRSGGKPVTTAAAPQSVSVR